MIDRPNKQHKLKNWKLLNKNIDKDQQEHRSNRSCFEQQPKKYCPRKDSSKQKIFAKSKSRFNSFTAENISEASNDHKKNSENKTQSVKAMIPLPSKNLVNQGVQTSKYLFSSQLEFQHSFKSDQQLINVHQKYQKQAINNRQHPKSFYEIKNYSSDQLLGKNENITLNELIECDMVGIKQIKQEFKEFKLRIVQELRKQRQFMMSVVQRILSEWNKFSVEGKIGDKIVGFQQGHNLLPQIKNFSLKNYVQPQKLNHCLDLDNQEKINTPQQQSNSLDGKNLSHQECQHVKFQKNERNEPQQSNYSHNQRLKPSKSSYHYNIPNLNKICTPQFSGRKVTNQVVDMQKFNNAIKKLKYDLNQIKSITNIDSLESIKH